MPQDRHDDGEKTVQINWSTKRVESGAIITSDGSNKTVKVTVSIGITTVTPGSIVEPAAVISAAEGNLHEAKRGGRNRVVGSVIK